MKHRGGLTGKMGTPIPKEAAYVLLDGYAGRTKLFGVIDAKTHAQYRFTADRDCYRFKKGVPKWFAARHVRPHYANPEGGEA